MKHELKKETLEELDRLVNKWFDRLESILEGIPFYKRKNKGENNV